jgi:hypothetical protein
VDLAQAESAIDAAVESLEIWLAPPILDGEVIDPRDNPAWYDSPDLEQLPIAHKLAQSRDGIFAALRFSGQSAHEVALALGKATLYAVCLLAQSKDQQTLELLIAPNSALRTEIRGLGRLSATEAERVEAECFNCNTIEPCIANERRASNGSPGHKRPAHVGGSLAMQTSIEGE